MATYTYEQVAALLAAAFPTRGPAPSVNTLRNAGARRSARGVAGGMPPRTNSSSAPVALFDAAAVDHWITHTHPWAVQERVISLWAAGRRAEAIRAGRDGGMSWADLAAARETADGVRVTGEALRKWAARRERQN